MTIHWSVWFCSIIPGLWVIGVINLPEFVKGRWSAKVTEWNLEILAGCILALRLMVEFGLYFVFQNRSGEGVHTRLICCNHKEHYGLAKGKYKPVMRLDLSASPRKNAACQDFKILLSHFYGPHPSRFWWQIRQCEKIRYVFIQRDLIQLLCGIGKWWIFSI